MIYGCGNEYCNGCDECDHFVWVESVLEEERQWELENEDNE